MRACSDKVRTSRWIGIGIVQFERYSFDKVTQVICPANLVRIRGRSCAAYSNCPPMCVVWRCGLPLFWGQNNGCISIDDWPEDAESLGNSQI